MDLRKLVYLEAIFRLGGFTKAAEELHVSQPAITNAINALEQTLQVTLIERGPKTLEFTEAGRTLVEWARRIIADFGAAEREMAAFSESERQSLKLGISNMVGSWLYSEVYPGFMNRYSESKLSIREYPWAETVRMVRDEELELAYTTWEQGFSDPLLAQECVLPGELYLILPPKHDLGQFKRVPFEKLGEETLSVFAETSLIHKIVSERCTQEGVRPRLLSVTQHFSTMLELIDNGTAIGFQVRDAKTAPLPRSRYVLRQLDPPILLESGFLSRSDRKPSRIMRRFIDCAKQMLAEQGLSNA